MRGLNRQTRLVVGFNVFRDATACAHCTQTDRHIWTMDGTVPYNQRDRLTDRQSDKRKKWKRKECNRMDIDI